MLFRSLSSISRDITSYPLLKHYHLNFITTHISLRIESLLLNQSPLCTILAFQINTVQKKHSPIISTFNSYHLIHAYLKPKTQRGQSIPFLALGSRVPHLLLNSNIRIPHLTSLYKYMLSSPEIEKRKSTETRKKFFIIRLEIRKSYKNSLLKPFQILIIPLSTFFCPSLPEP